MSVMNRRNAVVGWLAWAIAKEALHSKSHGVMRSRNGGGRRRKLVVPAAALAAAVGGAVLFWRRQRNGDGPPDAEA